MKDFVIIGYLIIDEEGERRWIWREEPVDYSSFGNDVEVVGGVVYRTDLDVEFKNSK